MTTIYVKIIRWEKNGKEEIFRTTKPNNYVPMGATLVKELSSFTIGAEEPYSKPEKSKKKSFWEWLFG